MNYKRIYDDFIADRLAKEPSQVKGLSYGQRGRAGSMFDGVYYEHHHISPKAISKDNSAENIVTLTAEDHVRAHALLGAVHGGVYWSVLSRMIKNPKRKVPPTKRELSVYAMTKKQFAKSNMGDNNFMRLNEDARKNARKVGKDSWANNTGIASPEARKRLMEVRSSLEYRQKMSDLTSGENNAMFGKVGGKNPNACGVKCVETGEMFSSVKDAHEKHKGDITKAIRTGGTAGGYHWERLGFHALVGKTTREYHKNVNGDLITYKGETKSFANMCRSVGVSSNTVRSIAKDEGMSNERAFLYYAELTNDFAAVKKPKRGIAVRCIETDKVFSSLKLATEQMGGNNLSLIGNAIRRGSKSFGYHWEYLSETA